MSEDFHGRGPRNDFENEKVLATKTFRFGNKRYYLDVRENSRGRFVKITEVGVAGQKSRIAMAIPVAMDVNDRLAKIHDVFRDLPRHDPDNIAPDGRLAHALIVRESRRYYLDLKENVRGRFFRLAMMSMGIRVHVTLPADGIGELKGALGSILRDLPLADDGNDEAGFPKSKVLYSGNKAFYFDVGSNRFGSYLRISEVRADIRSSIVIPMKHCDGFRDLVVDFATKISALNTNDDSVHENGDGSPRPKNLVSKPVNDVDVIVAPHILASKSDSSSIAAINSSLLKAPVVADAQNEAVDVDGQNGENEV